ncbi:MAG TPA: GNAT family N-acetyltransferase [Alphaproteobacteria bacterium]|nr:GNAT family N-acetyltransferase [Alphaproteobacteria bacterium]
MRPEIAMRPAVPGDAPAIAAIHAAAWSEAYAFMPEGVLARRDAAMRLQQWRDWFAAEPGPARGGLFVLEAAGAVVGFCHAAANADPTVPARGELRAGYIRPDFRGGNAGPLIMRTLAAWLRDNGLEPAIVWVFRENRFRHWYHMLGWRPAILRDRMLDGHAVPETGYFYPDGLDALIAKLDALIARSALPKAA